MRLSNWLRLPTSAKVKRFSTTSRISLAVTLLSVTLLLCADVAHLIPDPVAAQLDGRKALCEAIAIESSTTMAKGDLTNVKAFIAAIADRNADILSAGIRRADGKLAFSLRDHADRWNLSAGKDSIPTQVRVPIFRNGQLWGDIEICFTEVGFHGWGPLRYPLFRLGAFLLIAGFVTFRSYLRKVFQYLDPSMVVPERVKTMLNTLAEGVVVLDMKERVVLANHTFSRIMEQESEDLIGLSVSDLKWERQADVGEYPWLASLKDSKTHTGVNLKLERHGRKYMFNVNAAPILGGRNEVRGALVTFDDVTSIELKNAQLQQMLEKLNASRDEINRQNRELQQLAMTDPLTGCLNRRAFFTQFENHWAEAKRYGHMLSCIMLDVDFFKKVNDKHGHATGDVVLQRVAAVAKQLARSTDVVCRYGGEEFCVLLTHTDMPSAVAAAERFRQAIKAEKPGGLEVTASLGLSGLENGAATLQDLLKQADEALYAAKRNGRNRVEVWTTAFSGASAPKREEAGESRPAANAGEPIPFRSVVALMSALGQRDRATAAHSQRVADLCVMTAQGLLPVDQVFILEVAALLHDVGKLGVPDSILLKPGALTDDEWKIMRDHDRLGAEIVASAFGSDDLTRIIQTHHSFFGKNSAQSNSPTGPDIPVASRILMVADAFDAMVNNRPYRKARSREAAIAELHRCAGTQFDPQIVERFIAVITRPNQSAVAVGEFEVDQVIAGVMRDVERLACALDAKDLDLLAVLAGRLSQSAKSDGVDEISRLARQLQDLASVHPDVLDVVKKLDELMQLCAARPSEAPTPSSAQLRKLLPQFR